MGATSTVALPTESFTIIRAVVDTSRSPVLLVLNDTVWRRITGPAGYVPAAAIETFTVVSRPPHASWHPIWPAHLLTIVCAALSLLILRVQK